MLDLGAASDAQRADGAGLPADPHADDPAVILVTAVVGTRLNGRAAVAGPKGANGRVNRPVQRAAAEIHRRVQAGETPVGLNRLSEVLAPVVAVPPAPRRPIDDPDAIVEVVRRYPCAVVDAPNALSIARCLAAVLTDGRRVVVTGTNAAALGAVRAALPEPLRGLCLDGELPLTEAEVRELRWLMVTETAERRDRFDQVLPDPALLPPVERVAQLCRAAGRKGHSTRGGADLIPELLGGLDAARLAGLIDTANRCLRALAQLDGGGGSSDRPLLERVLFGGARAGFEKLLRRTGEVEASADKLSTAADRMGVTGELPEDAIQQLRVYADFLEAGGKARTYFRSAQQRAVEPVLRHLQLDGVPTKDSGLLRQAIAFLQLIKSMDQLKLDCDRLGIPAPSDVPAVGGLNRRLAKIQDAVLAVGELRHEVLFIHPASPVSMPDLAATRQVATMIAGSGGGDAMQRARDELGLLADTLARGIAEVRAPHRPAPEARAALEGLFTMDVSGYLDAVADLSAARRQHADQRRLATLMDRLRAGAPGLASAWQEAAAPAAPFSGCGTARFIPLNRLLGKLPAADTADLVLLLGADALGPENLLVAAVAPRLLAVGDGFTSAALPAVSPGLASLAGKGETVLSALRRAGVPVVAAAESTGAHAASGAHAITGTTGVRAATPTDGQTDAPPSQPSAPESTPAAGSPSGRRELTEDEAAFMVLPLGIVPRQQDRQSVEADNKPEPAEAQE